MALVTLLLSMGPFFNSDLFGFFSPAEIALNWLEHLVELAVLAVVLTVAYTLLDEALPQPTPLRLAILCAMLLTLSVVLTLLLYAYYGHTFNTCRRRCACSPIRCAGACRRSSSRSSPTCTSAPAGPDPPHTPRSSRARS